jgi:hypothetical protein
MVRGVFQRQSSYSLADFTYTLYLIGSQGNMGRYKLARSLNISNAQARTILKRLESEKLLESTNPRLGHYLSPKGASLWKKFQQYLEIPSGRIHLGNKYTVGSKDAIACVEATGIEKLNTVILRDESLLNGALGCTVFIKNELGELYLLNVNYPPLPEKPLIDRVITRKINRLVSDFIWNSTLIIVGTADNVINAQIGAISAGLLLVPDDLKAVLNI